MDPTHLQELIDLEDGYWWHVAKRALVSRLLKSHFPPPGRLVEGGIGSARNLIEFQECGYQVTGFDIMPDAVSHARQRGIEDVHVLDLAEDWPLPQKSVRAVILLDVLEHLADPVQVLRNAASALEPEGGLIVTVPAYPWLYSAWDRHLGHHRRYTANELTTHARQAGLSVAWLSHWNAFTLPAAIVMRGLDRVLVREGNSDFPRVSPAVNSLLMGCARVERKWLLGVGLPVGLSLVGVLKHDS